jgi:hypothetical protein
MLKKNCQLLSMWQPEMLQGRDKVHPDRANPDLHMPRLRPQFFINLDISFLFYRQFYQQYDNKVT